MESWSAVLASSDVGFVRRPTPFLHTTSERYILTAVGMITAISAFTRDDVPLGRRKRR